MAPSDNAQEGFHHGKNSIGHRRVQRHRRMVAQELKSAGFKVYAAARRVDRMADLEKDGITPVALDLTRDGSIAACVNTILSKEKSIDVLVNNAGYGSYGAIEDVPLEEGRRQFEVNLFAWHGSSGLSPRQCGSSTTRKSSTSPRWAGRSGRSSAAGITRRSTLWRACLTVCGWSCSRSASMSSWWSRAGSRPIGVLSPRKI